MKCSVFVAPLPHRLTWLAIVAERAPQIALLHVLRNQTSFVCSDYSKGGLGIRTPERGWGIFSSLGTKGTPGKEREDYYLSGPGDKDPRERIRTSLQPGCCCLIMLSVFRSSHYCQPPDPCHPVRILLATQALQPLPLFSHQKLLLSSLISWAGCIKWKKKTKRQGIRDSFQWIEFIGRFFRRKKSVKVSIFIVIVCKSNGQFPNPFPYPFI